MIGRGKHRVGEQWVREETFVHDDRVAYATGYTSHVVHTRTERVRETVLAVDEAGGITERRVVVETKKKVDENVTASKREEHVDPTSGKQYRIRLEGTLVKWTNDDGSSVTVAEDKTLRDLAALVFDRNALSTVPSRPITVGEVFASPAANAKNNVTGDLRLASLHGAGDDTIADFEGTIRSETYNGVYVRRDHWRIRAKDGWTIELTSTGEKRPLDEASFPKATSRTSSKTRVTLL